MKKTVTFLLLGLLVVGVIWYGANSADALWRQCEKQLNGLDTDHPDSEPWKWLAAKKTLETLARRYPNSKAPDLPGLLFYEEMTAAEILDIGQWHMIDENGNFN